jgi:TolB-like protein/DNA-binding winged helix-turn-helix (wHTH) protein/Tfp pilus assembly protein PilF
VSRPIKSRENIFFGEFELDRRTGQLQRNGVAQKLQPQPAKVLNILVERAGDIVTRTELAEQVWGSETHVDFEHGLNFAIRQIRAVLEDDAQHPRYLETVHKHGYRFIAALNEKAALNQTPSAAVLISSSGKKRAYYLAAFALVMGLAAGLLVFKRWLGAGSNHNFQSVAVLPLHNLSADPQQEYFSQGMTDELITDLAKVSGLRVISHTSVEHYRETKRQLPEIARELGVDAIVEGTIVRSGDRVRITAQLIDAYSDQHIWAESYERDFRDVLSLQSEVAQQIANQIGIKLTAGEQRRLTAKHEVDPGAHEAYLKGAFYWKRLDCSDFETALKYFEEAATKDPNFAPAYSGMAESYFYLADWRCWPQTTFSKVEPAALKAVELDPSYGEAYARLGELAFYHEWDWTKAGNQFSKALGLDPNNADILSAHAIFLVSTGKGQPALIEMRKAQELDPVSENTSVTHVYVLYLAHKYDEAILQSKEALKLFPDSHALYYWLAQCYERKRMPDEAITAYLKALDHSPEEVARRRAAYEKHGLPGYWQAGMDFRKRSNQENDPVLEAMYYAHIGQNDRALERLELGFQQRCDGLQFIKVEPVFESLRNDPRFKDLMARLRL